MKDFRVMHYLNQFFAGEGGEDKADVPLSFRKGPIGPGKRLQSLFGGSAEIVVSVYCGDNYFAEHVKEVLDGVLKIAREHQVNLLVAGPCFDAGRYGFACEEICHFLSTTENLDCVTAMHVENPGVIGYKGYKDRKVYLFPTAQSISDMENALSKVTRVVSKMAAGSPIGSSSEEGYVPRGFRPNTFATKTGAERAFDMLLDKLTGRPFTTEIPIENLEPIPIPPPMKNLKNACLALASTAGIVPVGNPDGFKMMRATQFKKYSIANLNSMLDVKWEVYHCGYNTAFMVDNPNYGLPVDVCRQFEREGAFAKLYPYFYGTTGVIGWVSAMETIGKEMLADMKAGGVDGVLLVST